MTPQAPSHAHLMDDIYRHQRKIYDATRKYYLLGRNLDLINQHYPGRRLYGFDISEQMLESARQKLGGQALLAQGDACGFHAHDLFRQSQFDHVIMSYSLSMIPNWQAAIAEALRHLDPGGTLHLVDFGDQARLPDGFKALLRAWLGKFHVSPRDDLGHVLAQLAEGHQVQHDYLYRNYAQIARVQAA